MKILFVGVFDTERKSTNTSQLVSFKRLGHEVVGYNYRDKGLLIGARLRDQHLAHMVKKDNFNLVVYSKCNEISEETFEEINKHAKTCLWFMDPLTTYDEEMRNKTDLVDYFCCDKKNVLEEAKLINKNAFHVCEGFDQDVDKPQEVEKEYDVSFIGNVYGERSALLRQIKPGVKIISNVYGTQHALEVSKSKINLNFCTANGASDRIYKILAAKGFLLSNDWHGREKDLIDGVDCVVFDDVKDLNRKISFFLKNPDLLHKIANNGYKSIQKFNRLNWAKRIIEIYESTK